MANRSSDQTENSKRRNNVKRRISGCLLLMLLTAGGCATERSGMRVLQRGGTLLQYDPALDRIVYLGHEGGPNAVNLMPDLYRAKNTDLYFVRGGTYTWLSPQSQWSRDGKALLWPPEPAMDTGPMRVLGARGDRLDLLGPILRDGLRKRASWSITADGAVTMEMTLLPAGGSGAAWSVWSTSTAPRESIVAVLAGTLRFDHASTESGWSSAIARQGRWLLIDTGKLPVAGKVFIAGPPVVASWREGQWLLRVGDDWVAPRPPQESAVEVYADSAANLIELELIGPYRAVKSDGSNHWRETWRLIDSVTPDPGVLDPFVAKK